MTDGASGLEQGESRVPAHAGDHVIHLGGRSHSEGRHEGDHAHVDVGTVEAVVRSQMAQALGGRRGMVEAALPTITFTFSYIATKDVRIAIGLSLTLAALLLAVRLVQRSSVQYVVNAFVGIGIGTLFVWMAHRNGGDADAQALAYFLPGLIYNAGYAVVMSLSVLVRWPVVGFMVGAVSDDPLEWRKDPRIVRLCSHLTWMLVLPCVLRVLVQLPVYLMGRAADDAGSYINLLGISKVAMGWPLQLAALAAMVWLLNRDRMPGTRGAAVAD